MPKKGKQSKVPESGNLPTGGVSGQPSPLKSKKIRILAKMIVKASRKKGNEKKAIPIPVEEPAVLQGKLKKPRKPATGRALEWQQEFARIRKQYPGKVGDEFRTAIKRAGEKFKARSKKSSKKSQLSD